MNLTDRIIAYEVGELDQDDVVALFQELVDNGMAWELQGHYGRTAAALYKAGLITDKDGERYENLGSRCDSGCGHCGRCS